MRPLASQGALDLGQFEFTDWEPVKNASANKKPLQNIDASHIDPSNIVVGIDEGIEQWHCLALRSVATHWSDEPATALSLDSSVIVELLSNGHAIGCDHHPP